MIIEKDSYDIWYPGDFKKKKSILKHSITFFINSYAYVYYTILGLFRKKAKDGEMLYDININPIKIKEPIEIWGQKPLNVNKIKNNEK